MTESERNRDELKKNISTNLNCIPITLKYAKTTTGTNFERIVQKLANYRVLDLAYFIFHISANVFRSTCFFQHRTN